MELSGLHLLLTYQCNLECDHCFVWGSPWQSGTMTLDQIRQILQQARELGTVESIYLEGGEPFLYYPIMLQGIREAVRMGFVTGIVTNSYWATTLEDALVWLEPLAGLIQDLSVSSDLFHWNASLGRQSQLASEAAERLGIPIGVISIAGPEVGEDGEGDHGAPLMYRGRAVKKLADRVPWHPWESFAECPYENLRSPERLHLDPLGNLHICQGIVMGNLFERPLSEICQSYDPDAHPIIGPLLHGGPAELARRYRVPHGPSHADACHLCDQARHALRSRFPEILKPDQVYGTCA